MGGSLTNNKTPDKLPPHDTEAEEAVLGSLLIDGGALQKIGTLSARDFYTERNKWIYEACLSVKRINQITVAEELERNQKFEKCGGGAYLCHLISVVPTSLDIEYYAEIVSRLSASRHLITAGGRITNLGYEAHPDIEGSFISAESILSKLRGGTLPPPSLVTPRDISNKIMEFTEKPDQQTTVDWGWVDLDKTTGGLYPGELTVLGARPSVGKSEIMLEAAVNIARRGKPTLLASLEMSLGMLVERLIASETGVPIMSIRHYDLTPEQEGLVATAAGKLSDLPLYFLVGHRTVANISDNARRMKEKHGLAVIFVDYLQMLPDCNDKKFGDSKNERVGYANKMLKRLSVETDIPVVAGCQLNRALEYRAEKTPRLADLRDSGEIEQDTDNVLFLHREEMYAPSPDNVGVLEIKQAKHRQLGDKPPIRLMWLASKHKYVNSVRQ